MFYSSKEESPRIPIAAIKVEGEYYPCTYQSDYVEGKEVKKYESFVRGKGWKKSKKGYYIPPIEDWTPRGFHDYLDKWGKYVLMYAVTGRYYNEDDCVGTNARCEVYSGLSMKNFGYIFRYAEQAKAIDAKIKEICDEKYKNEDISYYQKGLMFKMRPCHYMLYSFIIAPPNLDVVADDDRLARHFMAIVQKFRMEKECTEVLPVCMKDRLVYLFSQEVADLYENLLDVKWVNPKEALQEVA